MTFRYSFPPMKEYELQSALRTIWLSDHEQPVLDVTLQLEAGRSSDPQGLEGCAEIMANLMQKGPLSGTHEEHVDAMEQVGASQVLDVGDEHMTVGVRSLRKWAGEVVPRFWETLGGPALEKKEFDRVKREMITALEAEYADPATLAGKHFQSELYGSGHPLGRIATVQSVKRITLEDVRACHDRLVTPRGSCAVVAGDESVERMEEQWKGLFGRWQGGAARPESKVFPADTPACTRVRLVDKPDSSQTTVIMGHPAVRERHEARNALSLGNYVLGGGNFSSRLMQQIRSRTGKTYGIASQLISNRDFGTFLVSTTTQNHQVKDVLSTVMEVYREVTERGVTDEELEKAKQFAIGNLAFQLEGIGNVAEKLLWLRFYGYDNSYIENYPSTISAVDIAAVNSALQNVLACPGFVIAAVGKRSEVEKQLKEFGEVRTVHFRSNP